MHLKDYTVIITADEHFTRMWHTQLLYAEYLSQITEVLYIEPPTAWKPGNILKFFSKPVFESHASGLRLYRYRNLFPSALRYFNEAFNERVILEQLQKENRRKLLFWHFDSYRSAFPGKIGSAFEYKRIYHVIDPYYKNPFNSFLSSHCDLLVLTSPRNQPFYKQYSTKTLLVPQVIDIKKHLNYLSRNGKETPFAGPYLVLLGTFSNDVDYHWLRQLAVKHNLLLIGRLIDDDKKHDFEKLLQLPQVKYKGELDPQEFYPLLKPAAAGLIVYTPERRSRICSPLKAMNYLLAGLPVLSNIDCEIPALAGDGIFYSDTLSQLEANIERLLRGELKYDMSKPEHHLRNSDIGNAVKKILQKLNIETD